MTDEPAEYTEMAEERADGLRLVRRVLVILCVVVAFNVLLGGCAFLRVGAATSDNCDRIHQLVKTLDTIIQSGEAQTRQYVKEGTLTPAQAARAAVYREKQRQVLAGADCTS